MSGYFRKRWTKIAAAAAAVVAVALPAAPAAADDAPGERPDVPVGTWLAARTQPAVQLTSFTYTGTVAVPTSTINETAFSRLTQQAVEAVQAGKISSDERSIAKWLFQRIAADVDTYLTETTPERTVDAEVGGLCTGWWVTPDGYMVTGAHCVQVGETELSKLFAQQALAKFNEQDAKEIIAGLQGIEADEEILKLAQQIYVTFNTGHMKIRNLQQSLSVLQSLPGGGVDKTAKATPAELVSVGESYPGKDFALLKVNGQQNLPTVPLGEDADVRTGDTLYISGFPGLVTNTPFFSLESRLEPALTEGPYNAKRTTQTGVPYIQTQAPSYHGNSGGPVFSKDGKVVGMLIAGTVSEGGEASESESFVLPVSIIKEKLGEKNVKPAQAVTTTRYNEALNDYFRNWYEEALPKFREVQALFPNHPYVAKYISDTQAAISAGKDESPKPILMWVLIAAGVLLAIVLVGVVVKLLGRRRRARSDAPPYGAIPPPPWQQHQLPPSHQHQAPVPPQAPYGGYNGSNYGYGPAGQYGQHGQHGQPYLGDQTRDVRYGQFSPPPDGHS
ncbi:peptidase S1 and S6, chymotrypsin/Hap [[Actinomadura] parvosata subsp. kistnae]|uniref:S1 family peptidase n=1 Tax=[Actinomadura] parvosata TaxID=1955412 RepID=UPI000D2ABE73|nr:serine protease [Nonomuraea sp. ATCC 55076]SPL93040.1 peptidase S1 and S6, chymotrypsin/Hap [Actinomadura parvosata subsp. kistnae]